MKKLFAFFIVFMSVMPVFAEGEGEVVEPSNNIASTSYVQGAYDAVTAITNALNERVTTLEDNGTGASLTPDSLNVTGAGPFLSDISISDTGVIDVTKGNVNINQDEAGSFVKSVSTDESGNIIVSRGNINQNGDGAIVTSVSADDDGNIIVSRGNINQNGVGAFVTSVSADDDGNISVNTGGINVEENGDGSVVTSVAWDEDNSKLSVTKGNVKIPVGDTENPTEYANIWIQ